MRRRVKPLPSIEQLRQTFTYDPNSGLIKRLPVIRADGRPDGRQKSVWTAGSVHNIGYRSVWCIDQQLLVHRLAWALHHGEWPTGELDHRDNDKTNNRIDNLREATRLDQMRNRPGRARSGAKGVSAQTSKNGHTRYYAKINLKGGHLRLGGYDSLEEAAAAYRESAKELFGDFANYTCNRVGMIAAMVQFNNAPSTLH